MKLTQSTGPGLVEALALRIGDVLIRAGQRVRGRYVVQTPRRERVREDRWIGALQRLITFGEPLGFSQRKCIAAGIVTRAGYDELVGILRQAGILETFGRSGTAFGPEWDKRRALCLIKRREVPGGLPCPTDHDPPAVLLPRTAVAHRALRAAADRTRAHAGAAGNAVFARDVDGQR